jgi:hypothetical protein
VLRRRSTSFPNSSSGWTRWSGKTRSPLQPASLNSDGEGP